MEITWSDIGMLLMSVCALVASILASKDMKRMREKMAIEQDKQLRVCIGSEIMTPEHLQALAYRLIDTDYLDAKEKIREAGGVVSKGRSKSNPWKVEEIKEDFNPLRFNLTCDFTSNKGLIIREIIVG